MDHLPVKLPELSEHRLIFFIRNIGSSSREEDAFLPINLHQYALDRSVSECRAAVISFRAPVKGAGLGCSHQMHSLFFSPLAYPVNEPVRQAHAGA